MNIYSIYKATNLINGKIYIGFTNNVNKRIREHCNQSNPPKTYFGRAIQKYGKENFHWDVIYQSLDKNHTLKVMEPFFITEYNSYLTGYNSTVGGEGTVGLIRTSEHSRKISESKKGKSYYRPNYTHSKETRLKIGQANKGKTHSDETKQHLRNLSIAQNAREDQKQIRREYNKIAYQDPIRKLQCGNGTRGTIWINNGIDSKMINPDELSNYIEFGWNKGRGKIKK